MSPVGFTRGAPPPSSADFPRPDVLDDVGTEPAELQAYLVAKRPVEAHRVLEAERLQVERAAAALLGAAVQLAQQPPADAVAAVRGVHPHLPHLAAEPPGSADGAADELARGQPCRA